MRNSIVFLLVFIFLVLLSTCSGVVIENTENDTSFIDSIEKQVVYQITCNDAVKNFEKVEGSIVKWSGRILGIWNDQIQIRRIPAERYSNNTFLLLLDHPLPQETHIGDLKQTVMVSNTIWILGRITEVRDILSMSGMEITVPVLKGFVISKDNDRTFDKPVWVIKR